MVENQEGLTIAVINYLTRYIRNMLGCHEDKISNLYFGYAIILDFYNITLEDVLAHNRVDITLAWKVLKYLGVCLILLYTYIIFHGDIKTRIIL